jgi:2-polyprenyl-3-methyl-5-hydroxy-6-metoxy-1,4-benzoquinol methylase
VCSGCGASALRPFLRLTDSAGHPAVLLRCRRCHLVQVETLPSEADLAAHYSHYSYDAAAAWEVSSATAASLRALSGRLQPYRTSGRLLDVGCGAGAVMRALGASGWNCEGLEVSDVAVRRLREEGYRVHIGTLETLAADLGLFDVVVISETIEHVRDPRGLLAAAARVIRPGGALYLTTPHVDSLSRRLLGARWRPIDIPEHLFYFERRSMKRLLQTAGLRPVEVWTDGINPFEILGALRRPAAAGATAQSQTDSLREAALHSPALSLAKASVNAALRMLRLGDTLKVIAESPAGPSR